MTVRINCWSGPRNLSTALMRSFSRRADTRAVDEPLYGHYLKTTGAPHPGRDDLVQILETDANCVIKEVILGHVDRDVLFLKQMVHHLTPDLDLSFLDHCVNVMLVRDPAEVISSLVNQLPDPGARDVGVERQVELFRDLSKRGQEPSVVDARALLLDPEGVLRTLCDRVGIGWDQAMLSWPAGTQPEDGPWSKYWYDNVQRSTGFEPYRQKDIVIPPHCAELLDASRVHYEELVEHAITAKEHS